VAARLFAFDRTRSPRATATAGTGIRPRTTPGKEVNPVRKTVDFDGGDDGRDDDGRRDNDDGRHDR